MKKKLVKLCFPLVCAVIVLDLTGGKLAQPERNTKGQDPFIGFHLVPERLNTVTEEDGDQWTQVGNPDRSQWVEYGTETMEIGGFGKVEFPREVLIGTYNEQTRRYEFPGMEGFNCFLAIRSEEGGERYINGYTDMMENHVELSDQENTLSGALYVNPQTAWDMNEYVLTAYRVYQMENGTVYLDGTGNSYGGPGFTISERAEYTTTVNGETKTQAMEVEFALKDLPQTEQIRVLWFGAEGEILGQETFSAKKLDCDRTLSEPVGAVWALVEELGKTGGNVTRSIVEPDQQGQSSYRLILPDERGVGRAVWLNW